MKSLEGGGENTEFFHQYANFRKSYNTIWELQLEDESTMRGFRDLSEMGVSYFKEINKELERPNIEEIIKISGLFPQMVLEEDNQTFNKANTKEELLKVMASFKKDRIPKSDGWSIEFFNNFSS